jgi:colanic acid/amylovoran biosynthesis glycosyltransferase
MLPYSETFVAAQGIHLERWRPVFAGATVEKSGLGLLKGAPTCILADEVPGWARAVCAGAFKKFGMVPGWWLGALRRHGPDLLHVHFGTDGLAMGLPLAARLGIPLVVTFHGYDITIDDPDGGYQKGRPRLFRDATKVIAVSDFIAGQLERRGCPREKIIRHYIGIDLEHFRPLDAGPERKDVVFVGRLTEKKGCRDLIEAMLILKAEGRGHHLHVIGDGALKEELAALAAPLGGLVTFHGRQGPDFVREKVGRAAVFCAPSVTSRSGDAEGLGMVNLEAMAMRTPVVSTFHTAIPEAVLHERTGILVAERDPPALARALARCLDDPALAESLGEAGLRHVREHFDIRKQCRLLEEIYDGAIGARGGQAGLQTS